MKVKVTHSCLTLQTPGLYSAQNSAGQNSGVGSLPSPGGLPNPGIDTEFPALQADSLPAEPLGDNVEGMRRQTVDKREILAEES